MKIFVVHHSSCCLPFSVLYSVAQANVDSGKNMLLLKNPLFLPNDYETRSKLSAHEQGDAVPSI